ncbi:SPOR domain-containing protein [Thiomicrospira pelophila]|uniref:SPOR domain-containing protein n=1 Tax=Thiomicrospira pelophila TaxID=934 RepID=UPI0004A6B221|nr:SPOR domain-containing protein [Thiomicrospira pelophila]
MDELTKYRITGAVIWLALLILLVPSWYANPVDYEKAQPWLYSTSDNSIPAEEVMPVSSPSQSSDPASEYVAETSKTGSDIKSDPQPVKSNASSQKQTDITPKDSAQTTPSIETSVIAEPKKPDDSIELDQPMSTEETAEIKEPVIPSEDKSPAWLVRVASYSSIESANRTLGVLEMRYKVTIGDFSTKTQKIYSVRVGPFSSFEEAQEAKTVLDKELVTNSVIVQIR